MWLLTIKLSRAFWLNKCIKHVQYISNLDLKARPKLKDLRLRVYLTMVIMYGKRLINSSY
jgi:hypothetical protein